MSREQHYTDTISGNITSGNSTTRILFQGILLQGTVLHGIRGGNGMQTAKKRKTGKRSVLVIIGAVVIVIAVSLMLTANYLFHYLNEFYDMMGSTIHSEELRIHAESEMDELMLEINDEVFEDMTGFAAFYLDQEGTTRDVVNGLGAELQSYAAVYLIRGTRSAICDYGDQLKNYILEPSDQQIPYVLDAEQTAQLCTEGALYYDGWQYKARQVRDGLVVLGTMYGSLEDSGVEVGDAYGAYSDEEIMVINESTGVIENASDPSLIDLTTREVFYPGYLGDFIEEGQTEELLSYDTGFISPMADGRQYYMLLRRADDTHLLMAYIPLSELTLQILRSVLVPIILFAILTLVISRYALYSFKRREGREKIRLGRFGTADKRLVSHITAMLIFAILLSGAASYYVQTLIDYSNQNVQATSNLKMMIASVDNNERNCEAVQEDFVNSYGAVTQMIARYYMHYPDKLEDEHLERFKKYLPGVSDITIYDSTGTSVASTSMEKGYTLSQDSSQSESDFRKILSGDSEVVMVEGNMDWDCYIAGRRQDKTGIVRITVSMEKLQDFKNNNLLENALINADCGLSSKIYISPDYPEILYWLEPSSDEIQWVNNPFTEDVLTDGFAGIRRVGGTAYYINTETHGDQIFMTAILLQRISDVYKLRSVGYLFLGGFLLFWLLLIGSSDRTDAPKNILPEEEDIPEGLREAERSKAENEMDEGFKLNVLFLIKSSGVMLVLILFLDRALADPSILSYLFSSQWTRGLNLFSMTMILLTIVTAFIVSWILRSGIRLLSDNMGPRGMTIGHMMISVSRFAILLAAIVICLTQLGANLSALLAGAGIFGAAVSLCAQSTINDLISGFFIVFEGVFQIGDWIVVDDWKGQVIEIGIRTTKLARSGMIHIVNNSKLSNITITEPTGRGAVCTFSVAYREDIDSVLQLIRDGFPRYREEIPEIQDGPYLRGVTELGDSGITIEMAALTNHADASRTEHLMLQLTKRLFDEHGIEIPFPQVQLHMDPEEKKALKQALPDAFLTSEAAAKSVPETVSEAASETASEAASEAASETVS